MYHHFLKSQVLSDKSDLSDPSDTDIDVMLYILSLPDFSEIDCALYAIPAAASKYRFAPGLPRDEVIREINGMICQAFLPLGCFPEKRGKMMLILTRSG